MAAEHPTPRQLAVLSALSHGLTQNEVGRRLFLARNTVNTHLMQLYDRLGARNAPHAIAIAYERGLLPLSADHTTTDQGGPDGRC